MRQCKVGDKLFQFDLIGLIAKIFAPLVAIVTGVRHVLNLSVGYLQRPVVKKIPAAVSLSAMRANNLLDGLSSEQLEKIRARLTSADAIRDDNAAALRNIDKRFGITSSAETEYQDFSAIVPH